MDEPEISVQLMDLYYKNIDNGSSKESNSDVQAYTDYFLYELTYTLANDINISATNLDGYVKQVSTKEWGRFKINWVTYKHLMNGRLRNIQT